MLPPQAQRTTTNRLYFDAPRSISVRRESLPPPGLLQATVRTVVSAVSAGTEMLFYRGQAPSDMALDATLASLSGACEYPLRYGYACVGIVERLGAGVEPAWLGRRVFAFEPHASAFVAPVSSLVPLPETISDECAALLPNAETATNLVLDGAPLVGERVVVFGAGIVGLLTTTLLARFPLDRLVVIEPHAERRAHALRAGAHEVLAAAGAAQALHDFDLVFELSGNPAALNNAIDAAGYGARVVVGSWYGAKPAALDLGGHYHRNRIQLIGSQVSTIAPGLSGRWDKPRRIAYALNLLASADFSPFITHRWPFADAANAYRLIDQQAPDVLQLLFRYGDSTRESVG